MFVFKHCLIGYCIYDTLYLRENSGRNKTKLGQTIRHRSKEKDRLLRKYCILVVVLFSCVFTFYGWKNVNVSSNIHLIDVYLSQLEERKHNIHI